ncbi:Anaphase-promoting complex subunit 1 [Coemansia sp. RSA 552]|nr:Anaphase-promoting complex subunit 1 [Coemansia sp. RSA 552]
MDCLQWRRQRQVAVLDDPVLGIHKAFLKDGTVSWTLNGRFVRSFRLTQGPQLEHALFARFSEPQAQVEPALCLFLPETLSIYYHSGEAFTISLPFGVRQAFALQTGLLVQRRAAAESRGFANLPTLFSLMGPRCEFKMLGLGRSLDLDRVRRGLMLSPTPNKQELGEDSVPVFNDPNAVLLGVGTSRHDSMQFVLCWDSAQRRLSVYQCITIDQPADDDVESLVDASSGAESSVSQLSAIGSLSASRPRMSHQPSMSVQRRTSTAAAAAAAKAVSRRRRMSGLPSAVKSDRRSSMLGRVSFNDSPAGPNYAAVDIFREQRQMKAEVVLQLCWANKQQQQQQSQGVDVNAQICVVQSASAENIVCVFSSNMVVGLSAGLNEVFRLPARSMAPVRATRPGLDDLLLVSPSGTLVLFSAGGKPIPLSSMFPTKADRIAHTEGEWALLVARDGTETTVSVHVRLSRLARAIAASLSFVLSRTAFPLFWRCLVASLMHASNAENEMVRLSSLLLHGADHDPSVALPSRVKTELRDRAHAVVFALRLVREDASFYKYESAGRLLALDQLVLQFARVFGQRRAYHALLRLGTLDPAPEDTADRHQQRAVDRDPVIIPSFLAWALTVLGQTEPPLAFPTLEHIAQLFGITDAEPAAGAHEALKQLATVGDVIYQLAARRDGSLALRRLANEIAPLRLLYQMSLAMQWLVCATISQLRTASRPSWPASVLALLGRHDMIANARELTDDAMSLGSPILVTGNSTRGDRPPAKGVVELCEEVVDQQARQPSASEESVHSQEYHRLAFSRDLRLDEARRLLSTSDPTYTTAPSGDGDEAEGQGFLDLLARRVLALPSAQSLLCYSTQALNPQDALHISHPVVLARFPGHKSASAWTADDKDDMSWPLFHSGVSAALSIERDQLRDAHPSWVLLNWPAEPAPAPDAEDKDQSAFADALASHAGFLLGTGLLSKDAGDSSQTSNGPLCDMPPWQAFKYLSKRHGLTSIAILLGRACGHRGTMDNSVSKILSLHIPNLLPPGSSELMLLSYGTQAAAILGLGLLFMQSQNRRMVEVMLHELESIRWAARDSNGSLDGADPAESTAECYSLASGLALGLVVLGCGLSPRTLSDLHLLDVLSEAVNGGGAPQHGRAPGGDGLDGPTAMLGGLSIAADGGSGVSSIGAMAAIGLMFLGTNYEPAARRLELPRSLIQLRSTDPFTLLWKTLMRSLIMLDHIQPTVRWVESNMPHACERPQSGDLAPDLFRARLNIATAACFALSLKYAGSEDLEAHTTILHYFDQLEAVIGRASLGYESSLTRVAAQSCLDVLCVAAALVVAGSGDIPTMQRLRALHSASAGRSYGNHMATHMALGVLFLGGGARFTVSRSAESMALLLVAFFPRFPEHYSDNREHLQAWRHLWALCVVPRCLQVRNVVTGDMCQGAVVTLTGASPKGAAGAVECVPPVRFPSLAAVDRVSVLAPGFLPLVLDIPRRSYVRELLCRRRVLYLQPAPGHEKQGVLLGTAAAGPIVTQLEYMHWITRAQALVSDLCHKLARPADFGASLSDNSQALAAAIDAIGQLRICSQAARKLASMGASSASEEKAGCWAEATYLAWLDVRRQVVDLGRSDQGRRMLVRYWTCGSTADDPPAHYAAVSLLYAVLDLPTPADVMELAKQVPVAQLADYVLQ